MPNVYLLVDLSSQKAQRLSQLLAAGAPTPGVRDLPYQIAGTRLSLDGTKALFRAELTDQELTQTLGLSFVTRQLGTYDRATDTVDPTVFVFLNDPVQVGVWQRPSPPGGGS